MGSFSIWHWLIVLAVVLLLFGGRGKISQIMGDFGKGLKSLKKNMKEEGEEPPTEPYKVIPGNAVQPDAAATDKTTVKN